MSGRLTIEYVKKAFEAEDYVLLSKEYINNNVKLDYVCPKGHTHKVSWAHWDTSGSRCPYCAGQGKPTIEKIKSLFDREQYTLLSDTYVNSKTKLNYMCPIGHSGSIKLNDWVSGYRCKKCSTDKVAAILRRPFSSIKDSFEAAGYTVISKGYKNAFTKVRYICPNGHTHSIKWNDWQQGHRCPYCAGLNKPLIEDLKSRFKDEGYKLLSSEYTNSKTKLDYICPNNHVGSVKWNDWQQGNRCAICSRHEASLKQRTDKDIIVTSFKESGWGVLPFEYKSAHQKIECICPNGHEQTKTWNKWQKGQRCKICADINNSGKNCYLWKGGVSFEVYCEAWKDLAYKQDIRDRDDNKCLNPYCSSKQPNDLTIHHIDYDKKNCSPKNLITVCRSCNSKANTDREWHKGWYQAIINNRYGQ